MAPLILDDFEKVYEHFPILIAKLDAFKPVMLLSNDTSCPYLQEGKCSIYEKRPPACKIYPFSPWYDSILLDLSCKGIGIKGETLPLTKKEFYNSKFFDERIENITEKIKKTSVWLQKEELIPFKIHKGIELFKLAPKNNKYNILHQLSLKHLNKYYIK
jgi:hypothetical protein